MDIEYKSNISHIKEHSVSKDKKIKNLCYVKIIHLATGKTLHSHPIKIKKGSKQQEVTCFDERDDNDWWRVHSQGEPYSKILNNDPIRLEHVQTGMFLHSHNNHKSPSSKQQEVTCFWERDDNDYWSLELQQESVYWKLNQPSKLIHGPTNAALHSHTGHKADSGQQEVTCFSSRDENDFWKVIQREKS